MTVRNRDRLRLAAVGMIAAGGVSVNRGRGLLRKVANDQKRYLKRRAARLNKGTDNGRS